MLLRRFASTELRTITLADLWLQARTLASWRRMRAKTITTVREIRFAHIPDEERTTDMD